MKSLHFAEKKESDLRPKKTTGLCNTSNDQGHVVLSR